MAAALPKDANFIAKRKIHPFEAPRVDFLFASFG
jgi:hypothetical protein